ncbi:MAG: sensor histidine kinase [Thermoleophilaceae bacterium]
MSIKRLARERFDQVLAAALGALFMVEAFTEKGFADQRLLALAAALPFCASLAWRRRLPAVPIALAVVVIEVSNIWGPQALGDSGALLFGLVISIYSGGAYAERRQLPLCVALVLAAIPLAAIEPGQAGVTVSDIAFFLVFLGGPFVAGRAMRRRRIRERSLEAEAVQLEQQARHAVADERTRIARELHDVVAHAVSVVVLQARGARKLLPDEQAPVREALDTIEHSAGEALAEMRRLLSLLRETDEELNLTPQPSLRRLEALVESVRGAGLPVELKVEGELGDLPPGVDVSAYRIVQEALTNAMKHAGPAHATVTVRRSADDLAIDVIDTGAGGLNGAGSGHGLVGMRERVSVYGGRLEAGRRPEGGYALRAWLPLGPAH